MAYPLFHAAAAGEVPMVMTREVFASEFPGEGDHIEFRQGLPETNIREAVVAFSNTDGGVILLGVRDDGVPQGISDDGETVAKIHRMVVGVRDPGRYDVHSLLVADRTVLVLSVQRRFEGFTQMHDGRILVRRGAMNAPVFGDELIRFVTRRALTRFESTPVAGSLDDADPALVAGLARAFGWTGDLPARLVEAGLLQSSAPSAGLTVAGALYLLARPADLLGKAYIEVFRYRDGAGNYDRRYEIAGPLDRQVEECTRDLMAELASDFVVLGVRRHELPRIPEAVLREAIANAVAHRTYENPRQPVRVEIYPDRVVIRSPGGLPEPVTLANMRQQNAARNVHVIRFLRRLRLAEDAGLGVGVMEDEMEAALLERPRFDADESYVEVLLRFGNTVTPHLRA